MGRVAGHIWNLPNTIVGGAWALANRAFGGEFSIQNGAIVLENAPLQPEGSAITLGDVVVFGGRASDVFPPQAPYTIGQHEFAHLPQGRVLGPLYLPANVVGWTASLAHFAARGFSAQGWLSPVHGPLNFMERGPLSTPPRATPWR